MVKNIGKVLYLTFEGSVKKGEKKKLFNNCVEPDRTFHEFKRWIGRPLH